MEKEQIHKDISKGYFKLITKDKKTKDVILNGLKKMEQLVPDCDIITKNDYRLDIDKLSFIVITTIENMSIVFCFSKVNGDGIYLEVEDFLLQTLLRNSKFISNTNDERSSNFYMVDLWEFLEVHTDIILNYVPLSEQIKRTQAEIRYSKNHIEFLENELIKLKGYLK